MRIHRFTPLAAVRLGVSALSLFLATTVAASTVEVKVSDPDGRSLAGASVKSRALESPGPHRLRRVSPSSRTWRPGPTTWRSGSRASLPSAPTSTLPREVRRACRWVSPPRSTSPNPVTVSPNARDTFESYQPASVLGGEDLQQRLGNTLGATLASEPGVNVRSFGSGNARPMVRGLDNDRVLILENGARTGDLSSQSADHGVTLDPATATQIEVVRGPATLLYGSSAIGGVVNLVSDEIATKPRATASHGAFTAQARPPTRTPASPAT